MKLKPGDKVSLRKGLIVGNRYYGITFRKGMDFTEPVNVTAVDDGLIITDHSNGNDADDNKYFWCYSRYMLKKV